MTEETSAPEGVTEEVVTEAVAEQPEIQDDPETVEFARMVGWKAPDEWQGEKPAGYMASAKDYVERAKSILPFKKLEEQFTILQQTMDKRIGGIESAYQAAMTRQKAQADDHIKALQARQRQAVEEGDTETWERARRAEDTLRESLSEQPKAQPQVEIAPEVRDALDNWRVDNDWFGQDDTRTKAAAAAWNEAEAMGIKNPQAILKYVDKKITAQFTPEPQRKSSAVEEGLSIGGGVEAFSKLPSEAKNAFKRMAGQGLFTDDKAGRAQYAKDYENA